MTNYTKQARAGIVREVALLHCDNVGATVEWERPQDTWLGKREWSVSFHYTDASGREYWGTVFVTGTVELYTRNTRTGMGMLVSQRSKLTARMGLSDTGRYLIQCERRTDAYQHDPAESDSRAGYTDSGPVNQDEALYTDEPKTIDCTPSWSATARMLIALMDNGTDAGKAMARAEITRMGALLDHFVKQGAAG